MSNPFVGFIHNHYHIFQYTPSLSSSLSLSMSSIIDATLVGIKSLLNASGNMMDTESRRGIHLYGINSTNCARLPSEPESKSQLRKQIPGIAYSYSAHLFSTCVRAQTNIKHETNLSAPHKHTKSACAHLRNHMAPAEKSAKLWMRRDADQTHQHERVRTIVWVFNLFTLCRSHHHSFKCVYSKCPHVQQCCQLACNDLLRVHDSSF